MRSAFTIISAFLAACSNGWEMPSGTAAARFADAGAVPECAILTGAQQQHNRNGGFLAYANYEYSDECGERWEATLDASGFAVQSPHGERIKSSEDILVTSGAGGHRTVFIESAQMIEGVAIWERRENND